MADSGADDPSFTSPTAALSHYRTLCTTLQSQLQSAEDDLRDLRELQDELERELERFEDGERGMRGDVEGLREEREEWKVKLESLRSTERGLRDKLREVEVDNDDLEGRERATSSSLADLEARYNKSLERIALLEGELVGKARLEEECQRARDELRAHGLECNAHQTSSPPSNSLPARLATNSNNRVRPAYARSITHDSYDLGFSIEASSPAFVLLLLLGLARIPPSRSALPLHEALTPPLPLLTHHHLNRLTLQTSPTHQRRGKVDQERYSEHDKGDAGYDWTSEEVDGAVGPGSSTSTAEGVGSGRREGESEFGELGPGCGRRGDDEEFDYALAHYLDQHDELTTIKSARLSPASANADAVHPPTFTLRPPRLDRLFDPAAESVERLFDLDGRDGRDESGCVAYAGREAEFEARSVGPGGAGANPPVAGLALASSVRGGATHVRRQSSTSSSVSSTTSGRSTPSEDPLRRSTIGLGRPSSAMGQSQGPTGARGASGGFGLLGRRVSLANGKREKEEVPPVPRLPGR
ncbi:NADH:ubiquinone oxidoreductase [Rhodotorula toruloides]